MKFENISFELADDSAMSQCIRECIAQGKSQDQAIAICYSKLGAANPQPPQSQTPNQQPSSSTPTGQPGKTKSKLELLTDFKKNIEKNGYVIDDAIIESLLKAISGGSGEMTHRSSYKFSIDSGNWIKIFPKGSFFFEKYGETFTFDDNFFNEIINNFNSEKLFKPYIDIDHNLEEKYADILNLQKRSDGLYANISPNAIGLDAIKNNKYSYVSPEWGDRIDTAKQLHKNVLWAVTLTNIPAFEGEIPKIQDQIKLNKKGVVMDLNAFKAKISEFKGRSTVTLADSNVPMIDPNMLNEMLSTMQELVSQLEQALGKTQQQDQQIQQQGASLAAMKKEKEDKEIEDFFSESVKAGKIEVAEVEDMKELYRLNKEKVVKMINGRKGIETIQMTSNASTGFNGKLTKEDYDIMENLGYDRNKPEDVALYIKSQKE